MSEEKDSAGHEPGASPEQPSHAEPQPAAREEVERRSTAKEPGTGSFDDPEDSPVRAETAPAASAAREAGAQPSRERGSIKQPGDEEPTSTPMNEDDQDERSGGGIGAALALWGPLLLILFLIFIFWGERERVGVTDGPAAPGETQEAAPAAGGDDEGAMRPQAPSAMEAARAAAEPSVTQSRASAGSAPAPSGGPAIAPRTQAPASSADAPGAQERAPSVILGRAAQPPPEAPPAAWAGDDPGARYWGPAPLAESEQVFPPPAYAWPPPQPGAGGYPPMPPPRYAPGWTPWRYGSPPSGGYAPSPPGAGAPGRGGYAYGSTPGYSPWGMPPPGYPLQSPAPWWGYPPPPGYGAPGYAPPGYAGPEYAPPEETGTGGGND